MWHVTPFFGHNLPQLGQSGLIYANVKNRFVLIQYIFLPPARRCPSLAADWAMRCFSGWSVPMQVGVSQFLHCTQPPAVLLGAVRHLPGWGRLTGRVGTWGVGVSPPPRAGRGTGCRHNGSGHGRRSDTGSARHMMGFAAGENGDSTG